MVGLDLGLLLRDMRWRSEGGEEAGGAGGRVWRPSL